MIIFFLICAFAYILHRSFNFKWEIMFKSFSLKSSTLEVVYALSVLGYYVTVKQHKQIFFFKAVVACPNFGHPAKTLSFTQYRFCRWKIILQKLWINCRFEIVSAFEWWFIIFVAYSIYKVFKSRRTKLRLTTLLK